LTYSNHESSPFSSRRRMSQKTQSPVSNCSCATSKRYQPSTVAGCHLRSVYSTSASVSLGSIGVPVPAAGSAGVRAGFSELFDGGG
jgi:hypothetical protein